MSETATYKVRLEPVGVEMDVREGETVLEAAFRQGIALMHGCKEGQCSSCKALLMEGDIELGKYSPSLEVAFQLAHVFGVPLEEVFQYPEESP